MKLSTEDLLVLQQVAITAATAAGRLIADHKNQSLSVQHKSGGESLAAQVVTEVDLLSEETILQYLHLSCGQYDLALLTEESDDDGTRLEKDHFWCIDPLDGTLSFIESTPGYAVSIALVSRVGLPLIGVIYDPLTHTLYSAVQGQGAKRNGQAWASALDSSIQGKALTLVCDHGLVDRRDYQQIKQALEKVSDSLELTGVKTIEKGGAAMNACWVIENQPACYFKFPKAETGGGCLWDFAAAAAIFHELNAVATDYHGRPLELNRADSVYMNHRGVMFASHRELANKIQELIHSSG